MILVRERDRNAAESELVVVSAADTVPTPAAGARGKKHAREEG